MKCGMCGKDMVNLMSGENQKVWVCKRCKITTIGGF